MLMRLKEEIKKLVELQEIDSKIYLLTQKKDIEKPAEFEEIKGNFQRKKSELQFFEENVKKLQLRRKSEELDLSAKEETVRKAHGHLYQLKTNKEYQAKLLEIGSSKADVSILEDNIIHILEELDKAEKELADAKAEISEQEKTYQEKERIINEELKDLTMQINNLQDKRSMLAGDVDKNVFSTYDKLIHSRGGVAIALVENGNCGACHMKVTAQTINEIKMYDNLIICETCVRILYVEEDSHL